MIDRVISGQLGGPQPESYYFQLIPINLSIVGKDSLVPAPGTTYKFAVFKGTQKFDENKIPIEASFSRISGTEIMAIPKCPLNFYLPNFTKGRKIQFNLKLYQTENNEEFDVGDVIVSPEGYINKFKNEKSVRFEEKAKIADDYELEYEVYIEKSRFALEKLVKEYKVERTMKSPSKERREQSASSNAKKNVTQPVTFINKNQKPGVVDETPAKERQVEQNKPVIKEESKEQQKQSKTSSVRNSRFDPKQEEQKDTKLEKQSQSNKSGPKFVPIVSTKVRPVTLNDKGASEIHMRTSQRLETSKNEEVFPSLPTVGNDTKQKITLILFLAISFVIMFFAMHPNRKV